MRHEAQERPSTPGMCIREHPVGGRQGRPIQVQGVDLRVSHYAHTGGQDIPHQNALELDLIRLQFLFAGQPAEFAAKSLAADFENAEQVSFLSGLTGSRRRDFRSSYRRADGHRRLMRHWPQNRVVAEAAGAHRSAADENILPGSDSCTRDIFRCNLGKCSEPGELLRRVLGHTQTDQPYSEHWTVVRAVAARATAAGRRVCSQIQRDVRRHVRSRTGLRQCSNVGADDIRRGDSCTSQCETH